MSGSIIAKLVIRKIAIWSVIMGIGAVLMLWITRSGIGLTPDSLVYISAARQLISGHGLMSIPLNGSAIPLTHFPPFYPLLLSTIGLLFNSDPWDAAYWLNSLLFGANAVLTAYIVYRYSGRSTWLAFTAAFFMIAASPTIFVHAQTWSEPLAIFLMLLGIIFLMRYLAEYHSAALIFSALALGLTALTRYAGMAYIIGAAIVLLTLVKKSWKQRLILCFAFLLISSAPLAVWSLSNLLLKGQAVDRQIIFHPLTLGQLQMGFSTIESWFLIGSATPLALLPMLVGLILSLCGFAFWQMIAKNQDKPASIESHNQFGGVIWVFSLTYLLFLAFTISFLDAYTPLDQRILSPQYVLTLLLALNGISYLTRRYRKMTGLIVVLLGVFGANYVYYAIQTIDMVNQQQGVLGSPQWENTPIWDWVRSLPNEAIIVTNDPLILYFYTGRTGYWEPMKYSPMTLLANPDYATDFEKMRLLLEHPGSIVIHFTDIRAYLPTQPELLDHLPLDLIEQNSVGNIYRLRP